MTYYYSLLTRFHASRGQCSWFEKQQYSVGLFSTPEKVVFLAIIPRYFYCYPNPVQDISTKKLKCTKFSSQELCSACLNYSFLIMWGSCLIVFSDLSTLLTWGLLALWNSSVAELKTGIFHLVHFGCRNNKKIWVLKMWWSVHIESKTLIFDAFSLV